MGVYGCNVDIVVLIEFSNPTSCSCKACRRGMRGSPAWEDAWRDALWTLAVQKRCVEANEKGCWNEMPRSKSSNSQILSLSVFTQSGIVTILCIYLLCLNLCNDRDKQTIGLGFVPLQDT